jgi:sulfatase maturation enzyme AslB (radical SAM superfamily)
MCANMSWESAITLRRMAAQNASKAKYADIKVGYSCNNDCLFCTVSWKRGPGDRDTPTLLNEVERIVSQDGVDRIVYSGGEPTFREDLAEVLRRAKALGIAEQNIQTNGRRLHNPGYLETLHEAGLTSCFVSIHGPDAPTHDLLTQRPGAFQQTCAGLKNVDRLRIRFTTNTVVCRQNYRSLRSLIRFLGSSFNSIEKAKLSYPELQGGAADNLFQIVAPLWEVAPYIREAIDVGNEAGVYVVTEYVPACLLGMHYRRADELAARTRISLSDLHHIDSNWRRPNDGVFYEACKECDLQKFCCGAHPRHHEAFGERSCFTPISLADVGR